MQQSLGRTARRVLLLSLLLLLPGLLAPAGLGAAAAAVEASALAGESSVEGEALETAAASLEEAEDKDKGAASAEPAAAAEASAAADAEASSEAESMPRTRRGVRSTKGGGGASSRRRSPEPSEAGGYPSSEEYYIENGGEELVTLMNTVRERRTKALNKMKKGVNHLPYLNTDLLLGAFVTVLVVLYALKIRTRRYTFDELTLKMSRQARWFSPAQATYPADDGFTYVVSLDFRGLERVVLPKRYTQQEKEKLISLFEQTLQYFETVPPDETSAHLIENWSPSETIQPINISVVRLPYGQDASRSAMKRRPK